jgi:hypothetical protein
LSENADPLAISLCQQFSQLGAIEGAAVPADNVVNKDEAVPFINPGADLLSEFLPFGAVNGRRKGTCQDMANGLSQGRFANVLEVPGNGQKRGLDLALKEDRPQEVGDGVGLVAGRGEGNARQALREPRKAPGGLYGTRGGVLPVVDLGTLVVALGGHVERSRGLLVDYGFVDRSPDDWEKALLLTVEEVGQVLAAEAGGDVHPGPGHLLGLGDADYLGEDADKGLYSTDRARAGLAVDEEELAGGADGSVKPSRLPSYAIKPTAKLAGILVGTLTKRYRVTHNQLPPKGLNSSDRKDGIFAHPLEEVNEELPKGRNLAKGL